VKDHLMNSAPGSAKSSSPIQKEGDVTSWRRAVGGNVNVTFRSLTPHPDFLQLSGDS